MCYVLLYLWQPVLVWGHVRTVAQLDFLVRSARNHSGHPLQEL